MNPEEIQQAIDAGIASGMEALKAADNLSSITLIFGIVVAFLVVLVVAMVIVIIVVILWGRSQKGTYESQQRASDTTAEAVRVAAALSASNAHVLQLEKDRVEIDAAKTKAMVNLGELQVLIVKSLETVTGMMNKIGQGVDTVGAGQVTLNAAALTIEDKINRAMKFMSSIDLGVREFVGGLREQGYDIQKLAENQVRPTEQSKKDVREIADRDTTHTPAAASDAVPAESASGGFALPATVIITAADVQPEVPA